MWEKKIINRFVAVNSAKVICRIAKSLILKKKSKQMVFFKRLTHWFCVQWKLETTPKTSTPFVNKIINKY